MAVGVWLVCLGFLLVSQAAAQCGLVGSPPPDSRILNGFPALPCSLPWHVSVHYLDFAFDIAAPPLTVFNAACSGVIIDENHVVFNPTCIFLFRQNITTAMQSMVLAAGDLDYETFEGTEQFRLASEIYFQPEYPFRNQRDLQLAVDAQGSFAWYQDYQGVIIRVNEPFVFGDCVSNACLPEAGDELCSYDNCIFSGNGVIGLPFTKSPQTRMTKLSPLSRPACAVLEQELGFDVPLGGTCARAASTGIACTDDAGGPLVCKRGGAYFLRGTSVADFCDSTVPALFWDAALHVDFLNNVMSGLAVPEPY